ncbi:hypothetical protein SAMN05216323_104920 [Williamwhitmania taraxaci]|uniref:Uncharacterized protein n=1 Tax=Williamwhitmania taraxaci TaxID=1640674 RepID=A0A1G6PAE5_9BACT|nr:hypothetical protein SAMN05216323_104920 [Williamwhitmania taraxaci]
MLCQEKQVAIHTQIQGFKDFGIKVKQFAPSEKRRTPYLNHIGTTVIPFIVSVQNIPSVVQQNTLQ